MKTNNSTKKTSQRAKIYLFYIAILFWIVWSIRGCIRNGDLKAYNKVTTGYIYKISKTSHSHSSQYYYFYVDGKRYEGSLREVIPSYEVGDSLLIRYFPADPNNNRSEKDFQSLK